MLNQKIAPDRGCSACGRPWGRLNLASRDKSDRDIARVARRISIRLGTHGPATRGAARRALTSRDRPLFEQALTYGEQRGWLAATGYVLLYPFANPEVVCDGS